MHGQKIYSFVKNKYTLFHFCVSGDNKKSSGPHQVLKLGKYNIKRTTHDIYLTKSQPLCEKLTTPGHSMHCRITFSNNNGVFVFCVTLLVSHIVEEEFWSIPFLQCYFNSLSFAGIYLHSSHHSINRIKVWRESLQYFELFHFESICYRFGRVLGIIIAQLQSKFRHQIVGFDSRILI